MKTPTPVLKHLNIKLSWRKEENIVVHVAERKAGKNKERSCPHSNKIDTKNV